MKLSRIGASRDKSGSITIQATCDKAVEVIGELVKVSCEKAGEHAGTSSLLNACDKAVEDSDVAAKAACENAGENAGTTSTHEPCDKTVCLQKGTEDNGFAAEAENECLLQKLVDEAKSV